MASTQVGRRQELKELRRLEFRASRIPAQDALEVFVPDDAQPDAVIDEMRSRTGFSRWKPVQGGLEGLILYEGGGFDPKRFTLRKGAWDHEHCKRCVSRIEAMEPCWVSTEGYTILCDECHRLVVDLTRDHRAPASGGEAVAKVKRRPMRLTPKTIGWGMVVVVGVLTSIAAIEVYTSNHRSDEFLRRTGRVHEGMTENEVRAAAGAPDAVVPILERATESSTTAPSCRDERSSAAMLYILDLHGWLGGYLGFGSGRYTEVVCLDASHIVLSTHAELTTH